MHTQHTLKETLQVPQQLYRSMLNLTQVHLKADGTTMF